MYVYIKKKSSWIEKLDKVSLLVTILRTIFTQPCKSTNLPNPHFPPLSLFDQSCNLKSKGHIVSMFHSGLGLKVITKLPKLCCNLKKR